MNPLDLEALKAKALAATPGPWRSAIAINRRDAFILRGEGPLKEILGSGVTNPNAKHIAAASPDVVLELIERIETMREALEEVALPPYSDSDPLSLLQTLMQRAREALSKAKGGV